MITPRVISLDLDDTLWPVAPVIAAAERELFSWLQTHHPRVVHGHDLESMRTMRSRIAAQFPAQSHDMTFLRRRALAEHFAAAGYARAAVESAAGLVAGGTAASGVARATSAGTAAGVGIPAVSAPGMAASEVPATGVIDPVDAALEIFFLGRNRVQLYDDVRPALKRLRAKYRLFALSNGNADLQRCGIADLFDGHVTAAAAGAAKPDARIFAQLVRAAGVEPIEVLHIGDDPVADVLGATQAGMQAAWLNREARAWPAQFARPLRTVKSLAEII